MIVSKAKPRRLDFAGFSDWLLPLAVATAAAAAFLVVSGIVFQVGFPLDDAWIHQTYARNLAQNHQWAFVTGQPSAGSTAPLWSVLLSIGFLFSAEVPYLWTFLLGIAFLALTAVLGQRLTTAWLPEWRPRVPLAGLFLALEWHLVWAGVSGMETALMAACVLAVFVLLAGGDRMAFWAGAVSGLTAWVRPDGITLLGPVLFCLVLGSRRKREGFRVVAERAMIGFLMLFLPYLAFNHALAGNWWPNTFYAKQAEYAVLRDLSILTRLGSIARLPMIGAGALLVPGFVYQFVQTVRNRDWLPLAACLWWSGYSILYAVMLPVTYQHGRYLIPAMPVFFVLGLVGTVRIIQAHLLHRRWWPVRTAWVVAIGLLLAAFCGIGSVTYAKDVAVIETEMVSTARWLRENTQPDERLAVHDIGAVGFFTDRDLVDLAGLVSPEVIPFIRDETRLAKFLDEQQVDYLVAFPDWYPALAASGTLVFTSEGEFSRNMGHTNMSVYRWTGAR